MELQNISIVNWIIQNKIKTENGDPYEFDNYLFMYDILIDLASLKRNVVCYKAAQIGFSTAAIFATLWIAKNKKIDLIYTLPTNADVKQFAGGKINRIIAQNPTLQKWVKEKDTIEQKTVADNIIYYRGTFSEKAAMMVSSDLNAYDEVDASKPDVIEQYATRLQASTLKREWFFSHPSTEGTGVAKHWGTSDQKHWFIKCPECKKEHYLNFPESFDFDKKEYVCKHCKAILSDDDRRKGRWVARFKDKEVSGYWIPLFICPWVSAKEIIKYYNTKSPEYFTNKVLGLPYVGGGNKLTKAIIEKNLVAENLTPDNEERIVIGVDTGIKTFLVAGGSKGLFYNSVTTGYADVERLLKRFPNSIAVIDQGGDLIGPRELREKYPGRIYLCLFGTDRKTQQLVRWGKNDEDGAVTADRNRSIQLVVDELTDGRIPIQGNSEDWREFTRHWQNLSRIKEMDKVTGDVKRRVWVKTGDSDLSFATVYWRVGMSRFTQQPVMQRQKEPTEFYTKSVDVSMGKTIEVDLSHFKQSRKQDWRNM